LQVLLAVTGLVAASVAWAERRPAPVAGRAAAAAAATPAPPRVWSRGHLTWIHTKPSKRSKRLGYIRVGTSVSVRDPAPRRGPGCGKGFVAIEPYGYVCLDRTSTLDFSGRYLRAMRLNAPRNQQSLPFRYALSNGTPMYRRLPTRQEWERAERWFGAPGTHRLLSWGNRGHEQLAEQRVVAPTQPVPFYLAGGGSTSRAKPRGLVRRQIPLGSMLAYTGAVEHEGRTFLLSADGTVVPADRVRPYRESVFQGVQLGRQAKLPLAWVRAQPQPKYWRDADGSFSKTRLHWSPRSWIELEPSTAPVSHAGRTYWATRDRLRGKELWIDDANASIVRLREKLPWGVTERDKWLIVSITRRTLVAYEGRRPVFTTLVSPGAGGVPRRGQNPVKMSTTPLGVYRVTFKHWAADMSPEQGEDRSFWIADVPHTQYFNAPFALHTAYWHENFGELMSAGCINLSPRDGRRLFLWTEPRVPRGWHGAAPTALTGKGTYVVVTR
jgi:hypothetical protein